MQNMIHFIDGNETELFQLPNNGYVQVDYPNGETILKRCMFIDLKHAQIGKDLFHLSDFDKRMRQIGASYQAEPNIMGEEAAWRLDEDKYLAIQTSDAGYEFSFLNEFFVDIEGGVLANPELSMLEARTAIFHLLEITPKEMRVEIYEEIMEQVFETGRQAEVEETPKKNFD